MLRRPIARPLTRRQYCVHAGATELASLCVNPCVFPHTRQTRGQFGSKLLVTLFVRITAQ
jgi:hypothetical protein